MFNDYVAFRFSITYSYIRLVKLLFSIIHIMVNALSTLDRKSCKACPNWNSVRAVDCAALLKQCTFESVP